MKCSFCDLEYPTGTGFTFYRKDGSALRFCSRRCERFMQMKRNPRKLKWTKKFEKYGGGAKTPMQPAASKKATTSTTPSARPISKANAEKRAAEAVA